MKRVLSLGIFVVFLLSLGATLVFQVSAEGEEYMVWIATSGKGKKYHEEDCRTLKKGKRSIPLSKAKAMGYFNWCRYWCTDTTFLELSHVFLAILMKLLH